MSEYLLNGQLVSFSELIRTAQDNGYHEPDGVYTTSCAAQVLREAGYTVMRQPEKEEEERHE